MKRVKFKPNINQWFLNSLNQKPKVSTMPFNNPQPQERKHHVNEQQQKIQELEEKLNSIAIEEN